MKLVTYHSIKDEAMLYHACRILTAGYDSIHMCNGDLAERSEYLSSIVENGYDIHRFVDDEKAEMHFAKQLGNSALMDNLMSFLETQQEVGVLPRLKNDQLWAVLHCYPACNVANYVKPEFSQDRILFTRNVIKDKKNLPVYLDTEYSAMKVSLLYSVSFYTADIKPFTELSTEQLQILLSVSRVLDNPVWDTVKNNIEFYKNADHTKIPYFVVSEVFNLAEPASFASLSRNEIGRFLAGEMRKRVTDILQQEYAEGKYRTIIDVYKLTDKVAKLDYDTLLELMKLHSQNIKLTPYLALYALGSWFLSSALITLTANNLSVEQYLSVEDFLQLQRLSNENTRRKFIADREIKYQATVIGVDEKEYDAVQLSVLYTAHTNGIDVSKLAKSEYDYEQMEYIAESLENGIDISELIIPFDKIRKSHGEDGERYYANMLENLAEILREYNFNLFPEFLRVIRTKSDISVSDLEKCNGMSHYFKELLDFTDDVEKIKTIVNKLVSISLQQNRLFSTLQLRQLYLGILQNINITLYADPSYDDTEMMIIRHGLVRGVDMRPYLQDIKQYDSNFRLYTAVARHIIRILQNESPVDINKSYEIQSGIKAFDIAVNIVAKHNGILLDKKVLQNV